jgi:hypothetical protein
MPPMRRLALWFLESEPGRTILGIVAALLLFGPAYFFGLGWGFAVTAGLLGFVIGWAAARRHWRKNGFVPKL